MEMYMETYTFSYQLLSDEILDHSSLTFVTYMSR